MATLHITKENFETEVLQSDKLVLVDFWAAWCVPCQILSPVIESIAEEATEVKVCKINVSDEPELAAKYHVMSIPTLMVVKDGNVISKSAGQRSKEEILEMLKI